MMKHSALAVAATCLIASPYCWAESTTTTPAILNSTSTARLDVTVVVPAVLYLRIGTGSAIGAANNTTVDAISFTVPGTNIGDGTVINASAASGDLTNGAVTVRVFSNVGGNVTLNSNVSGQLTSVAGDTIPWSQIAVSPAALPSTTAGFTNGVITHPAFSATSGNGTATTLTATGKLVRQEGKWTYTYSNANVRPAGTYGATIANNGRVTYTALQL
jgi:hypothetical protein